MKQLSLFFLNSCLLYMVTTTVSAQEFKNASFPIADGTFIQNDLVAHWNDARWQQEFHALKEVGMHYIILAPVLYTGKDGLTVSIYPSNIPNVKHEYTNDLVETCLRNAQKAGFKVFLGLNIDDAWWRASFSPEWLYQQMKIGNQVSDELIERYKRRYGNVMYGWYWVWEVDNLHCSTAVEQEVLSKALNINIDHLHTVAPSMPFMLCPFMNYKLGSADDCRKIWENVFAQTHFQTGDIFAPQDCIGAGGLIIEKLDEWFRNLAVAVATKPGLLFWSDAETFDQRFWTSATLDRFVKQMNIVKPYVSDIVTFAYSHYYSPLNANKQFHEAYLQYVKTGLLPQLLAPNPVKELRIKYVAKQKIIISWHETSTNTPICGFYLYRNEDLIGNLQVDKTGKCSNNFIDKEELNRGIYNYSVCAYNCVGTCSSKSTIQVIISY